MVPIIFSAFANSGARPLSLIKERDALRGVFNDPTKAELKILDNASFDFIAETILNERLAERIAVFHFAGHADGKNIQLIDSNTQAEALVRLLKGFPNLQLVFLNGCDTYDQARVIQDAGIRAAVITTLKPVNDDIAINFASYFYYAFYRFNTINDSFESAQTRIMAKDDLRNHYFMKLDRGLGKEEENEIGSYTDKAVTVYTLSAPDKELLEKTFAYEVDEEEAEGDESDYIPNRLLIESISSSILSGDNISEAFKQSDEYADLQQKYARYTENRANNRNFSYLVLSVLTMLPFPLGFHVNLLNANALNWNGLDKDKKIELLKRQVITYNSIIQLLSFTLLSSFWSELEKNKQLAILPRQWKVIKDFFSVNELNNQDVNYPALLGTIREIFENNQIVPFITEYQDLKSIFANEDSFFETHLHIQGLKSSIANGEIRKMKINWLCSVTEGMLSAIFSKSGFVIRYKLSTVKNIEFAKSRLKKPYYYIRRIILDRYTREEDDVALFENYTDSFSVILAKGIDQVTFFKFLTLSPFIIDENAIRGEDLSKLYFYSHKSGENYVYRWAENPDETLTVGKPYPKLPGKTAAELDRINQRMAEIKGELEAFKTLINY
ncbi:MAG: CHAT domain-containing protein [Williamsia sp.]|nr:CHAT domain-containing protein [Williamsia sp.]